MFISLSDDYDYYANENEETMETRDRARKIAVECKDGIVKTVQACPYLNDEEREHRIKETLSYDQNTAVALLAYMFPCLERIHLTDNYMNEELHFLARKIDQANRLDPGGSHALSSYLYHEKEWTPPEEKSTNTSLELNECMIHIAALRSAFSGIVNLQDFTYEYYWAWEGPDWEARENGWVRDWQPGEIILSLLEFAGHSLVELNLTRNGSRETQRVEEPRLRMQIGLKDVIGAVKLFIGSLRGFQVLKYIRVQNEAFVEEDPEGSASGRIVHRLVDLLPASVVNISLAMPQLYKRESYRLMEGLPELKAERVPKLEKVTVESD